MSEIELPLEILSEIFIQRAREIPVEAIGLPARSLNVMLRNGINNSYQAVSTVQNGFAGVKGVGKKTIIESQKSVQRFINIVENATEAEYTKLLDIRDEYLTSADGNLVDAFPAIIDLHFDKSRSTHKSRNKTILYKRYGLQENERYILEDLGKYFDLTRERVRQVEAKAIKDIRLLLNGKLEQKDWKLCSKLEKNFSNFIEKLNSFEWLVLKSDIVTILQGMFNDEMNSYYLDLFMKVCGYTKVPSSFTGFRGSIRESWCKADKYNSKEFESIFQAVDIIYDSAIPLSTFDLIIAAKSKAKSKITNDAIKLVLSATDDIDYNEEKVSVKFSRLRSASDKAYRVLATHGKPLHFSKIAQEINLLSNNSKYSSTVKETNLTNQLVSDSRFIPIGRSGEWGLSSWNNIANITIIKAIEKVLHDAGKPMHFSDIENSVRELRPDASPKSLKVYLHDESLFTRVGVSVFALTSWRLEPAKKTRNAHKISSAIFLKLLCDEFSNKNPIEFPELISSLVNKSQLAESSVRQKILSTNGLSIYKEVGKRYKTVFCPDINSILLPNSSTERVLIRDKVQSEIRSILFNQPNTPIKKGELYKEIIKNIKCGKPTFYQYLDKMNEITQYKEKNDYYAVYEHEETLEKIVIDTSKYNASEETLNLLKRPLSLLTVENVDIALFEFGLLFENSLKQYLIKKRDEGEISVNSKDLSKLVNMINCVVRERIVTKGYHLNTLREERNNRAHGETLTDSEKRSLFNKAHYIADLFVEYICLFRKQL